MCQQIQAERVGELTLTPLEILQTDRAMQRIATQTHVHSDGWRVR